MAKAISDRRDGVEQSILRLRGTGHEFRTDSSYFYDARRRDDRPHFTIQLTLAGQGFYEEAGTRTPLERGMAFAAMIPGPFRYGYPPGARGIHELVFVSFDGAPAVRWHRRVRSEFGPVLRLGTDSTLADQMLAIAHASETGTLPDRYLLSARLYALLMTIYSTLRRARVEGSPRVAAALKLIEQHAIDRNFDVNTLARRLDCSREHLTRQFRAATGLSPSDYLQRQRVRLAAGFLRTGEEKLTSIAHASGFGSATYLCRTFRKHVGVTPDTFRKTAGLMVG